MRIFQDFLANNCVYIQYNRFITFLREAFSYQSCQGLEKLLLFVDGPLRSSSSSSPCHQFILFLIISTTNFIGKFSLNVSITQTLLLAIINMHLPYLAQRFYKKNIQGRNFMASIRACYYCFQRGYNHKIILHSGKTYP